MRRFWIMLVAVAMALAIAAPATGKKPGPTHFDVTFEFVDGMAGFSTSGCTTEGSTSIAMEAGPDGRLMASPEDFGVGDVPLLNVNLPGIEWYRYYPYYSDAKAVPDDFDPNEYPLNEPLAGTGLTGCHGAGIDVFVSQGDNGEETLYTGFDDAPDGFKQAPRFLMLTVGNGSVDFRWEADYYREWSVTPSKNPRKSPTVSISDMEGFSYNDNLLAWDGVWDKTGPSSGLVTGEINVAHFSPGVYESFPGSPVPVKFMMTIAPTSE